MPAEWFALRPVPVATVLGMAVVTYLTKASGLWVVGRLDLGDRSETALDALPGAIVVSILAPAVVTGGPATWFAAVVVVAVAWRTENVPVALLVGVAALLGTRGLL